MEKYWQRLKQQITYWKKKKKKAFKPSRCHIYSARSSPLPLHRQSLLCLSPALAFPPWHQWSRTSLTTPSFPSWPHRNPSSLSSKGGLQASLLLLLGPGRAVPGGTSLPASLPKKPCTSRFSSSATSPRRRHCLHKAGLLPEQYLQTDYFFLSHFNYETNIS